MDIKILKQIMRDTGLSKKEVIDGIKSLKNKGLVKETEKSISGCNLTIDMQKVEELTGGQGKCK